MSFVNAVARGTNLNEIYPIGSVIIKNAPWAGFAGQTWELFSQGKTLVGQDTNDADFSSLGQTGGSKTHTLTIDEMPSHSHDSFNTTFVGITGGNSYWYIDNNNQTVQTGSTGGNQPHSIVQPYQVVLYYRRKS
jgi:microcystin-dependent protein